MLGERGFAINGSEVIELLQKNAELQSWYPKLATCHEQVVATIAEYSKKMQNIKKR